MTVNELRAKLQDPVAVHVALVRGEIAKPPIRDMLHAYGAEALARWDAAPEAPPPVEARQPHNPWRASIENILTGDNYFRAAEWHELLADLDRLYAMPPAVKPLDDPRLQQAFGDAIEGALAFGYQQNNKPPVGHWLNRFWNIGSAEAEKASKPPIVTDEMVTAYLKANDEYWRKVDEIAPPIGVWRNGTPREATRESLRAALAAPAGAIQPHLDHQVGAPVTLSDAASEGWRRIESAPKDATPVLLYVPTRWNKWVPAVQGTGFWYASGWLLPNADEAFQSVSPTHWRPLHSIPRDPTLAASESVEELSTESTRTPLAAPQGGDTGAPS